MRLPAIPTATLAVIVCGTLACSADSVTSPSQPALAPEIPSFGAVDQNEGASYTWHIFGDITQASNGHRIELEGTGSLSIHPKSASGGGTFIHTNAAGVVLAAGDFNVTQLISFQSYGTSPFLPPTFSTGKAQFRVELTPEGTTLVIKGLLDVECRLPGVKVPGGIVEGLRLVVPGVANFNKPVSGGTLFIRTS